MNITVRYLGTAIILVLMLFASQKIHAQTFKDYNLSPTPSVENIISYFKYVQYVNHHRQPLPVPMELPINSSRLSDYVVIDRSTNTLQPRAIITKINEVPLSVTNYQTSSSAAGLTDQKTDTFEVFHVSQNDVEEHKLSQVTIQYAFQKNITTNQLSVSLDQYAVMPRLISIQAKNPQTGEYYYLVNEASMSYQVYFPQTTSNNFLVTLKYDQPIYVAEMNFVQNVPTEMYYLRFVARPNAAYAVYSMPEGNVPYIPYLDNLNLAATTVDPQFSNPAVLENPTFRPPDSDNDGVIDRTDNCPRVENPDQADLNRNNIGDACEDSDLDGIINAEDNCPEHPNPNQQDEDGDGSGDHCDGIESRWVEQMSFLPWLGIGIGFIVVLALFKFSLKPQENESDNPTREVPHNS